MRNPNGYGSVIKLSGNRRRPYRVRKTIGWNEKGHPIYQTLGYTVTREEGMILLATFNKDPWDVDKSNMTLTELFELWLERKSAKYIEKVIISHPLAVLHQLRRICLSLQE